MNLIFFVLMPRILCDRVQGTNKSKFWFFKKFSTSIWTHKPLPDRRIWNFHVLVPMVQPFDHHFTPFRTYEVWFWNIYNNCKCCSSGESEKIYSTEGNSLRYWGILHNISKYVFGRNISEIMCVSLKKVLPYYIFIKEAV